jgi:Family of unknown function (DUF6939)
MTLIVESRRKKEATLIKHYPDALLLDVTSKGENPWLKFSPFYPHGNIPVPFSSNVISQSVEGIWQGLKVFETVDIDKSKFEITSMKGLKRTVRKFGKVKGHRKGLNGNRLLSYLEARYQIYLPVYHWILENCLQNETERLRNLSQEKTVILLDYETNTDIKNLAKPLSHAGLIKRYIENDWFVKS